MTTSQLARILNGANEHDVKDAFTGIHPENSSYRWDCNVQLRGETIWIDGQITFHETAVGKFERQLRYEKGASRATHIMMELLREHQDKDVAKHHYRKALRFYVDRSVRYVHLKADVDGPAIWPQFAFDLVRIKDKQLLAKIMREHGVPNVPSNAKDVFAPVVAALERNADANDVEPLGFSILKELRSRSGQPLEMILDFQNRDQWTLLTAGGIIDS